MNPATRQQQKWALGRKFLYSLVLCLGFIGFSTLAYAGNEYVPLANLPGMENTGTGNLPQYINQLYKLLIVLGAIIGALRIAFAGVKYAMSDIVTTKQAAIGDITGVLKGLAILLLPAVVLMTINSQLLNLKILDNLQPLQPVPGATQTGTQAGPAPGVSVNNCQFTSSQAHAECEKRCTDQGGTFRAVDETNGNCAMLREEKTETCTYDITSSEPQCLDTEMVSGVCPPGSPVNNTYDSKVCKNLCAEKKGQFSDLGSGQGKCVFR